MVCTAFMAHDVCPLSVPAVVHRNKCLCYSAIGLYLRSLRADNVRGTARIRPPLLQRLIDIQWCIAKNGGGYTQRGVAKGFKVSCLFMITEVSIRYQKNPRRLVYGIAYTPAYIPQYTTVDISCTPSVCPSHTVHGPIYRPLRQRAADLLLGAPIRVDSGGRSAATASPPQHADQRQMRAV